MPDEVTETPHPFDRQRCENYIEAVRACQVNDHCKGMEIVLADCLESALAKIGGADDAVMAAGEKLAITAKCRVVVDRFNTPANGYDALQALCELRPFGYEPSNTRYPMLGVEEWLIGQYGAAMKSWSAAIRQRGAAE